MNKTGQPADPPPPGVPIRKSPITKSEVVVTLENMGRILEIVGANPFKIRALFNAAHELEAISGNLEQMVETGELLDVQGIGKSIFGYIKEMIQRGTFEEYERLKEDVPPGLLQVMRIPGMGPKKVKAVYEELNVKSVDDLEKVAKAGRIAELEGFGEKSQGKILKGIDSYRRYSKRHLLSTGIKAAQSVSDAVASHPDVLRFLLGGSIRRHKETIKDIDILASAKKSNGIMELFTTLPEVESVIAHGDTKSSVTLKSGINADLRVVSDAEFPFAALYFTGSKSHNTDMRARAKKMGYKLNEYGLFRDEKSTPCKDEAAVFKKLGLDYIPPELRESMGEIEAAEHHALPKLISEEDVKGILHVHTTYSDGGATVEEMAKGAKKLGFEYLGITDHSKSAAYAGGLSVEKVKAQAEEIAALNKSMTGFRIFHGIESDILADGSLDYDDDTLRTFDFVVASVHSIFNLSEAEMTDRIIRAIENPHTTILGHPTGRLLLQREGYRLNLNAVIDACAERGVAIEINAHPSRLDIDWRFARVARYKGAKILIGPDAHSVKGMAHYRYGVGVTRKGWLTADDVINTFDTKQMEAFFGSRAKVT
ncbi:MAG: DNA polymerase/3'-5' exonuclease PolX [bacterium]|nr:DNA polymerase/3'-5' exonuclease PolX [bacterium]